MNWSLNSLKSDMVVGIEDVLAIRVIDVLDVPRGTFALDPYADSRISAYRVPQLAENTRLAISELKDHYRRVIMKKLSLYKWPSWAESSLYAQLERDPLFDILKKLSDLCAKAMEFDSDIFVLGD